MTNESHINQESKLIQFLNELVHTKTSCYFKARSEYPIDRAFITANTFYAKVLFDVASGIEPRYDQFVGLSFAEGPDVVYQGAIYLYCCWKTMGLLSAVYAYCQNLNRLVENAAREKCKRPDILLPDFISVQNDVYDEMLQIQKEKA